MKNIADDFMFGLLHKIRKPLIIDCMITEIIKHGGLVKIDNLAKQACMSNRQFERAFKNRMGVSPKFYSRLVRFGKAWLLKETTRILNGQRWPMIVIILTKCTLSVISKNSQILILKK